jgi:hypothetical protein
MGMNFNIFKGGVFMKKILSTVLAVCFVAAFVTAAFAAETKAAGTIKSVDAAKGTVVFCAEGTKDEIPVKVSADLMKKVKAGEKVTLVYEKKGADNVASKIMKSRGAKVPVGC